LPGKQERKARKQFFFEKKNQKTFVLLGVLQRIGLMRPVTPLRFTRALIFLDTPLPGYIKAKSPFYETKMQKFCLCAAILIAELFALFIDGRLFHGHFAHPSFTLPPDLACFLTNGAGMLGHSLATATTSAKSCAFMYPPPSLLIAAPLSWLPALWTYILWLAASVAFLTAAARAAKFSWTAIGLGLASPPSLYCLTVGQNGEITSALLFLSLGLASTSPVLAGIFAGCLVIKPQFALLLPVCYLASRNWRALGAAVLTTSLLCLLSAGLFGFNAWRLFLSVETSTMRSTLNEPWPQPFQGIMISFFITLRSLGANLPLAYAGQILASLGTAFAAWTLWSSGTKLRSQTRLLLTLCLVPLATPYAFIYDIPGIAFALTALAEASNWQIRLAAAFAVLTSFYLLISMVSYETGGALLLILTAYIWSKNTRIIPSASPNGKAPAHGKEAVLF
jgi:Glycosyltransferase family 87